MSAPVRKLLSVGRRDAADPESDLLQFFGDVHAAAADLGGWDRAALERREHLPPV